MAFVNELVPEEQKSKFDIKVFYNPVRAYDNAILLRRWVIDRERDVFMILLGGGMPTFTDTDEPSIYYLALSWKGAVVKFEARYRAEGDGRKGEMSILFVEINNIQIPTILESERDVVMQLIREAVDTAGGQSFKRGCYSAVNILI